MGVKNGPSVIHLFQRSRLFKEEANPKPLSLLLSVPMWHWYSTATISVVVTIMNSMVFIIS